jgi:aminopeptidase N
VWPPSVLAPGAAEAPAGRTRVGCNNRTPATEIAMPTAAVVYVRAPACTLVGAARPPGANQRRAAPIQLTTPIERLPMPSFVRAGLAALLTACAVVPAMAQRATGVVGSYVPPRTWAAPPHGFDLLHQRIAVSFDVPKRGVAGEVTTRLVVTGAPTDTIRLNAENLTIDAATDPGGRRLRFAFDTSHVTVRLARRAAVGDTVAFTLRYHGTPERGLYFVPRARVIWTQGEATETRAWVPTYDAPDDKTTWEMLVTADSDQKVLSNGRLVDVTPARGGAAKVWHWSQDLPASTYLYSIVAGPFTVLTDEWRGIPVDYWVYPDTVEAAWRTFGETPSMIELYSELLVPFPWAKYDQSAIPDFTYGGMENVSATTQTDLALHSAGDEPEQNGRGLVAHELAHQWFGDLITTADWADAWLNEGMATYMESVEGEKTRGWDAGQLSWIGQQQQAMRADLAQQRPLVWGEYRGTDPITLFFSGHIYPKGAQLAHQLRRLLGDSLFWAGLRRFLTDNAFKPVTTPDFAVAFEKTCHCDLDWFFDQWAYGIGYPKVHWSRHWAPADKVLRLVVEQTQGVDSLHPLFRFPVTVRVITRDSVVRHEIMVSKQVDTFAIALPGAPVSVRFDEGGWLLGQVTSDQTPAELAAMAEHDLEFAARYWALDRLAESRDTAAVRARRIIALNEHDPALRRMALGQMVRDSAAEGVDIVHSALRDPDSGVRARALRTLAVLDTAAARAAARPMSESDPDNAVRAAALGLLARLGGASALPGLLAAAQPGQALNLRFTAAAGLARFGGREAMAALERLTAPSEDRNIRTAGLNLLAQADTARAAAVAARALDDPDPLFAATAVRVLARVGGAGARATLQARLGTETRVRVRSAIEGVLRPR